jgi:hypothetical protein
MAIPVGEEPSKSQIDEYYHNREYLLPILNREQKLRFSYLCTTNNTNLEPFISISTSSKGIRLKKHRNPWLIINPIWGVPVPATIFRGIIIAVVAVLVCGLFIKSIWLASLFSMFIGLFGSIIGAVVYKIEKLIKNWFTR